MWWSDSHDWILPSFFVYFEKQGLYNTGETPGLFSVRIVGIKRVAPGPWFHPQSSPGSLGLFIEKSWKKKNNSVSSWSPLYCWSCLLSMYCVKLPIKDQLHQHATNLCCVRHFYPTPPIVLSGQWKWTLGLYPHPPWWCVRWPWGSCCALQQAVGKVGMNGLTAHCK